MEDTVRISSSHKLFRKGFAEVVRRAISISHRYPTYPPTYGLTDRLGEEIKGKFYAQEIQKVTDRGVYKIEKILKSRRRGGKTEYYVKWLGYSPLFNSWVDNVESL